VRCAGPGSHWPAGVQQSLAPAWLGLRGLVVGNFFAFPKLQRMILMGRCCACTA
jgi:hypothetical protein